MVLTSKSEEGDKLRQQSAALDELAEIEDRKEQLQSDIEEIKNWISTQPVLDEHEIAKLLSKNYNLNMTKAKEYLEGKGLKYTVINSDKRFFGEVMKMTKSTTVPQILIKGEFVGDYNGMVKHFEEDGNAST